MDWRSNQWVGVGAAVLLVVAIVFLFYYTTSGPTTRSGIAPGEEVIFTMRCESTDQLYTITDNELKDLEVYERHYENPAEAKPCEICGAEDAHWVYYCRTCDKWYAYSSDQARGGGTLMCPEGHIIGKLLSPAQVEEYKAEQAAGGGAGGAE